MDTCPRAGGRRARLARLRRTDDRPAQPHPRRRAPRAL